MNTAQPYFRQFSRPPVGRLSCKFRLGELHEFCQTACVDVASAPRRNGYRYLFAARAFSLNGHGD